MTRPPEGAPRIEIVADDAAAARRGAGIVVARAREAIAARGRARIALSGGSTPMALYAVLAAEFRTALDWRRVALFFGDERDVPPDSPESNFGNATRAGIAVLAGAGATVVRWETERGAEEAARSYEAALAREFALAPGDVPHFDVVLLGLGADGHTASLFPGTAALAERARLAVANELPASGGGPASRRLTLTLPVLDAARGVVFLATGAGKAEIVARVLASPPAPALPATLVRPTDGRLLFLLDRAAARAAVP